MSQQVDSNDTNVITNDQTSSIYLQYEYAGRPVMFGHMWLHEDRR